MSSRGHQPFLTADGHQGGNTPVTFKSLGLMHITNSPSDARVAEAAGVQRIFIDLETHGKAERQRAFDSFLSGHQLDDISSIACVLSQAELLVRVNPISDLTRDEVNRCIELGAMRLMLPMATSTRDVDAFLSHVDSRVPSTFLIETPQALVRLPRIIELLGPNDEVHLGLTDLQIGLGLSFPFEVLAGGVVDLAAIWCHEVGINFGFGGIGRIGSGLVPAEWIIGEHVRLGSKWAILSREFRSGFMQHGSGSGAQASGGDRDESLPEQIEQLRVIEQAWRAASPSQLEVNRQRVAQAVFALE